MMGFEKITGAIGNRKAAVAAAALGVAAIGGLAWALCLLTSGLWVRAR